MDEFRRKPLELVFCIVLVLSCLLLMYNATLTNNIDAVVGAAALVAIVLATGSLYLNFIQLKMMERENKKNR